MKIFIAEIGESDEEIEYFVIVAETSRAALGYCLEKRPDTNTTSWLFHEVDINKVSVNSIYAILNTDDHPLFCYNNESEEIRVNQK